MTEPDVTALRKELSEVHGRLDKVAEDKAYFQLLLRLMELLNPLPGLEDMLRGMLLNIVECIGGTNIKMYYWVDGELSYLDFLGEKKHLVEIDDPIVAQVASSHQFVEQKGATEDALLMHGMLRGSWTWTFPLLVGQDLIGVIKLENLHIHGASLGRYLPIFFRHAALILANEIRNTAHRQSEDDLSVATERLRLATEAGLIGIWDWDIPRDELVWDESMYRLYGRRSGDFGGAYEAWIAAVHPDDKPLADGEIQAALHGEREYAPEFRVVWPDGSVHHIKAASRTLRDASGRPQRMVGINYDLTERKRDEETLRRLNRELRAISNCNQALMRAEDEQVLLNDICRIVCEEAGYRVAWVGYAEHDEAKTIRTVASAGLDEGYIGEAKLTWADVPLGRGPSGTAIRTGQASYVQDFATDPRMEPWREKALARGYRSGAAFPLKEGEGVVFGVLLVYAAEVNAITREEARLLDELAGDISFGISVLRTRARRREAEAQLLASERRFRGLVENMPDLVVRYDTSLRRTYVNPAWEAAAGFRAEEVVGIPADALPRANLPLTDKYPAALRRALATGHREEVEFDWVNARGETLYLQYVVVPEFDGDGKVVSLLAVGRDITERKRAEQANRANLRLLEGLDRVNRAIQGADALERMMSDVLAVVLSLFDCDRAFLLHPCDPEAPAWQVPMERCKPEYPGVLSLGHVVPMSPDVATTLRTLLAVDGPVCFGPGTDHPLPADAAERYGIRSILSMALRPKSGKAWQFGLHQCSHVRTWTTEELRLFEEIGRRMGDGLSTLLATRDLKDSRGKLANAQRIAQIGYWERDLERGRIALSEEALHIFGMPAEANDLALDEWHGHWLRILHPEDRDVVIAAYAAALQGGPRYDVEYRVVRADGEVRVVHSFADVVRDVDGRPRSVFGTMWDITERRRSEEELERHRLHLEELVATRTQQLAQARDAAESANRMKSVFLSNMSHELRTPLNAILGFAQIMERDQRFPMDQRHHLGAINRSGRHLLALINDVLEISRIESGRLKVQPVAFDLPDMLASLRESIEVRAREKGLRLVTRLSGDLPRFIRADAGKLRQVLLNLLSNAVKYTERGEIELAATVDTHPVPQLQFSVRDSGVGIAAGDLERIFQPFYQTDYGAALGEGTGLGLAISREYAQLLGGGLEVESELRRGSVFRLAVPVVLATASESVPKARGTVVGLVPGQPDYRVLVVEDDKDSLYLLEELLRQTGFQVHSAGDGEQAVKAYLTWHPVFIWMDMRMPVMDGYEATRRIRTLPGGRSVKIAALTASAFREDQEEILAAGCDEVLAKPLDEDKLFATMEKLLGLRYRYAEDLPMEEGAAVTDLSALPESLREELCRAAHLLDMEATLAAIVRIREIDANLADQLEVMTSAYRFDRIAALCDSP